MRARHGGLARRVAAILMAGGLASLAPAHADEAGGTSAWRDPVDQPSEPMPQAAHALMLGLTEVGNAAIAVGAHGIVLRSTDRSHWEQVADVPTRVTLTAVTAVGNKLWAVGHDGVILASTDAGQHWSLQRKDPWHAPEDDAAASDPRQGAPLLKVAAVHKPERGELTLLLLNRSLDEPLQLQADLRAFAGLRSATGQTLVHSDLKAINSKDSPDNVRPQELSGANVDGGRLTVTLPPASWSVVTVK